MFNVVSADNFHTWNILQYYPRKLSTNLSSKYFRLSSSGRNGNFSRIELNAFFTKCGRMSTNWESYSIQAARTTLCSHTKRVIMNRRSCNIHTPGNCGRHEVVRWGPWSSDSCKTAPRDIMAVHGAPNTKITHDVCVRIQSDKHRHRTICDDLQCNVNSSDACLPGRYNMVQSTTLRPWDHVASTMTPYPDTLYRLWPPS